MYRFESDLVKEFEQYLRVGQYPFEQFEVGFEFNYLSGKVDVIAKNITCELFSFEAKLLNWRKALTQAYRATSFSHYSYVILPEQIALTAVDFDHEFINRKVGLCSVNKDGIFIHISAPRCSPFQPWLTNSALKFISC
ncbi:hypothetical protein BH20ACI1_BH20ACI1_08160 [soil metagenome]